MSDVAGMEKLDARDLSKQVEEDCLECRLVSGVGAAAIGAYIYTQASKRKRTEKFVMQLLSLGVVGIGMLRLFNVPPFHFKNKS